jgi:hypothetical protein
MTLDRPNIELPASINKRQNTCGQTLSVGSQVIHDKARIWGWTDQDKKKTTEMGIGGTEIRYYTRQKLVFKGHSGGTRETALVTYNRYSASTMRQIREP